MDLSKIYETELAGVNAAIKAHEEGIEINKIVRDAFAAEIARLNENKK